MAKAGRKDIPSHPVAAPAPHCPSNPKDYVAAALTFLVVISVYLPMLSSTVTGEDSGDFIAAAYTLGIPHPPGYPLWCLLGKLFTFLPFGTIAWRVGAMSAFWGAVTAAVVCLIVIRFTRNRLAALAAGLAVAFSYELWEQSTIAEVYSLNAFFVVVSILILLVWQETKKNRLLLLFAAVYGLGVSNHPTMALLGPVFAVFILSFDAKPWLRWKLYLFLPVVALAAWAAVHLYLPIRAAAHPYLNWGDPVTWDRFWDLVLRRQYNYPGVSDTPRSLERVIHEFGVLLPMYKAQYTAWLAALPVLGLYPLWKHDRRRAALIVGTFLYLNIAFGLYLNSGMDDDSLWIITTFFIPAHIMAGIVMGLAADWLARIEIGKVKMTAAALAICIAMPVVPFLTHYSANDRSRDFYAYDYGMNILNTMEPDALYFASNDEATFPVIYLQAVEGLRSDITFVNKTGVPDLSLYEDMPLEIRSAFSSPPTTEQLFLITDWIIAHTDRPVYCNMMMTVEGLPGAEMAPEGLLYRLRRPGERKHDADWWGTYTWRHNMEQAPNPANMTASNIVAGYHYARGRERLYKKNIEDGLASFETAARVGGRRTQWLNDVARTCIDNQLFEQAIDYHTRALAIAPESTLALENLANLHARKNEMELALEYRQRLYAVMTRKCARDDLELSAIANDIAGAFYVLNQCSQAKAWLEHALQIDDVHYEKAPLFAARDIHNLSLILRKQGDVKTAAQYREHAIAIIKSLLGEGHAWAQKATMGRFIYSND